MSVATLLDVQLPSAVPGALSCRHCGEPCDTSPIETPQGVFCCAGCQSVFNVLEQYGLAGFYQCDVSPGVSQKRASARHPDRFAALDDPATAQRFIDFQDRVIARATFAVPAMHCGACVWLLEQLWRLDPGIVRADADLVRRTVRVEFRTDRVSLRGVAERLAAVGYEPALEAETPGERVPAARRALYLKIAVAGFAAGNIMLFSIPRYANGAPLEAGLQRVFDGLNLALAVPVLVYSASDYFRSAWRALLARASSLDIPIALGLSALFLRSVAEIVSGRGEGFFDSFSGLVLALLVGRLVQERTFDRIRFDRTLRSFFPLSVRAERGTSFVMVPLERLRPGDRIVVRPHETVPADAVLLDGDGLVDYAFVTGEQDPVPARQGEIVRAGGRVIGRALRLAVVSEVSQTRLARLWDNPAFRKPKVRALAGASARFGAWFTAFAIALAAAGAVAWWPDAGTSLNVATAVLIIACPCAMTLAAPITLGTAMGMLGRAGLYLKHSAAVLDLDECDTIIFDKTGTLTTAEGAVAVPDGLGEEEWRLARALADESVHPVSRAIASARPAGLRAERCEDVPGEGLRGTVAGHEVRIGRGAFAGAPPGEETGVGVSVDGSFRGWIRLTEPARPGIAGALRALSRGRELHLLSGDRDREAPRWRAFFEDRMWFGRSPEEKLAAVRERQAAGRRVLMVGDGLNDAGALAAADVGVAVSDDTACVVPACDAVIGGDRLQHLPGYLAYAGRARRTILLCFAISVVYNALGLWLALTARLTPLATAILMPISSLTVMGVSAGLMRWHARRMLPS